MNCFSSSEEAHFRPHPLSSSGKTSGDSPEINFTFKIETII
jgi:hypothetical protein